MDTVRVERHKTELVALYKTVTFEILKVSAESGKGVPAPELEIIETFFGSLEPVYHNLFTEVSFQDPIWQKLIKIPQELGHWENHLHFSNVLIADEVASDLRKRKANGEFSRDLFVPIRILEIGTGGCNTTRVVLNSLLDIEWENANFEYLGFDINPEFADLGNNIMDTLANEKHTLALGARDRPLTEPRLRRWSRHERFVERGNAPQELSRLSEAETPGSVDYFFTSYMLHHVPNGDALIKYLCGPRTPGGIHSVLGDPGHDLDLFSEKLRYYLYNDIKAKSPIEIFKRGGNRNYLISDYMAYSLSQFLKLGGTITSDRDRTFIVNAVREEMKLAKTGRSSQQALDQPWVKTYFFDPQRAMLQRIHDLLKVGGLVVIADPDGRSLFNRTEMANDTMKAVEMAVAHFRPLTRICEILGSVIKGFDVFKSGRVIEVAGRRRYFDFVPGTSIILNSADIRDNIGYFVVARKIW